MLFLHSSVKSENERASWYHWVLLVLLISSGFFLFFLYHHYSSDYDVARFYADSLPLSLRNCAVEKVNFDYQTEYGDGNGHRIMVRIQNDNNPWQAVQSMAEVGEKGPFTYSSPEKIIDKQSDGSLELFYTQGEKSLLESRLAVYVDYEGSDIRYINITDTSIAYSVNETDVFVVRVSRDAWRQGFERSLNDIFLPITCMYRPTPSLTQLAAFTLTWSSLAVTCVRQIVRASSPRVVKGQRTVPLLALHS